MIENEYFTVKQSAIHHTGAFAKQAIPAGTKVIEYIGEKISKSESEKRSDLSLEKSRTNPGEYGGIYIFELNDEFDLDGDIPENLARHINHSCEPNCFYQYIDGHIWIVAKRDIKEDEELTFNYGFDFDLEDYFLYPCKCGSAKCVGYILKEEDWPKIPNHQKNS
ncbi:MAG: SET domain-containing protein-lysine N-methyltransferase [Patescibacteria group bacterium]|jgi:hypothetical protein